jgi:hypothetical protein
LIVPTEQDLLAIAGPVSVDGPLHENFGIPRDAESIRGPLVRFVQIGAFLVVVAPRHLDELAAWVSRIGLAA